MKRLIALVLFVWMGTSAARVWSAPSADQLLPATTKGYLSLPSLVDFRERWGQTQLGQLTADPVMKPFVDSLQSQLEEKLIKDRLKLTLSWQDISEMCGGELCLATIQPDVEGADVKPYAMVLMVDITGRQEAAERVLESAAQQLIAKGAQRQVKQVGSHELVIYELPRERGEVAADQVVRWLVDDLLVVGNHPLVCEQILQRYLAADDSANLASLATYQRVMERVQAESGPSTPQVRWYLEPFGYADVIRAARTGPRKRRKDMLAILKSQGFDAVQAVGGFVHLATTDQEVVHRAFVFAPGDSGQPDRFKLAARMLDFPNVDQWDWPTWVPRDLASATSFRIKTQAGFEYARTLVDAVAGDEGFFEDLLASIKDDPKGPRIDVRKDFVAYLGDRFTVLSDHTFPITPQSERMLVAVEVTDEEAVRRTLHQALVSDPDARKLDVEGHTVWELLDKQDEESEELELTIDGIDPIGTPEAKDEEEAEDEEQERILRNSAITVARGHFIVATHVDFLRRILAQHADNDRLALSEDGQFVSAHLARLGAGRDSLRSFARTDEEYRPTYELIRQGRMPESESVLGRVLNRLLGPEDEDMLREQKIDGSQLPDFQTVRRYLGPAGMYMRSEQDGWYLSGVVLNKRATYLDEVADSQPTADSPDPNPALP